MVASSFYKKRVLIGQLGVNGVSLGVDDITHIIERLDSVQNRPATIRSPTFLWDGSLRFSRPNDLLYEYTVRTGNIQKSVDVFFPIITDDFDTWVFQNVSQELKNKKINPAFNNIPGMLTSPEIFKTGYWQANNIKGQGTMESLIHRHTPELKGDLTEGSYAQYVTPGTAESNTGNWLPSDFFTMTKFNPIIKGKFRFPDYQVGENRFFFGLVTADDILNNDTPFGLGDTSILIGHRNNDSDFKLFRGVGDGATVVNPHASQISISDSQIFKFEMGFRNNGTQLYYKINDGQEITFSTNLPLTNKWMKFHTSIQNTTTNTKRLDVFWEDSKSDK